MQLAMWLLQLLSPPGGHAIVFVVAGCETGLNPKLVAVKGLNIVGI